MFPNNIRKTVIVVAIVLIILIIVGYLAVNFIGWVFYSKSAKDINLKDVDAAQLFKEKFGVTLIKEAEVKNLGKITVSGFSPDGTSVGYYAKITLPMDNIAEFKNKNYTSIDPRKFDNEMFGYYSEYKKSFYWWNLKLEDTDYYLLKGNPSRTLVFCKPINSRVDIYLAY